MITSEEVAELLLSTTAGPWDWNEGYQGVSGANGSEVAAAPDMAALIAKQASEIERLKGDMAEHEKQWSNLQDLIGAYEAKCQENGIEVIKWGQDT
jgi:hypothetical protein